LGILSAIFVDAVWHPLTVLTPTAFGLAALTEAGTAVIVWTCRPFMPKPTATLFLASMYASIAAIAMLMLVCTLPAPGETLPFAAGPDATAYLSFVWKFILGLCAPAYVLLRRRAEPDSAVTRLAIVTAVPLITAMCVSTVFTELAVLPSAAVGATRVSDVYVHVLGPLAIVVDLLGALAVLRLRERDPIDRAFGFAILAVIIETVATVITRDRDSMVWFAGRLLYATGTLWVLVEALRTLVASRGRLYDAELALRDLQNETRRQADRARALWKIAANAKDNVPARLPLLLDLGREVLGRGAPAFASLSHLDRGTIEVDAGAGPPDVFGSRAGALLTPGARFPAARSLLSTLYAEGRSAYWNDLQPLTGNGMVFEQAGFEHVIGAPLQIGEVTYFLTFAVAEPMSEPFDDGDIEFVEILATVVVQQLTAVIARERLKHIREHDALTGLDNRARFLAELRSRVAQGEPFALAFVDLDRFGEINEAAGYTVGDKVLTAVANRIRAVAPDDFVARISGDNFAVILPGVRALDDASARLADYVEVFRSAFLVGEREAARTLSLTASFGAVLFANGTASGDELVRAADIALSVGKRRGGDSVVMFDPSMAEHVVDHTYHAIELTDAIDAGGLSLAYQPTFDLRTRQITGAEALVRWQHPTRGAIPPSDFVDFAERNGLIGRLSRWITDQVIADLKSMPWIPPGYRCNFNLATPQIEDPAFIADLEQRLRFVSTLTHHLGVEITETTAVNGTETARFALQRFRELGVRVAIDDFGTGYSSLSYLKRLPVDMIKIDRSFVTGLPDDERDAALCDLLLGIARRFRLLALAEGIETEEQLAWLHENGCDAGQGFLLARPMTFEMFSRLIGEYRPPPTFADLAAT